MLVSMRSPILPDTQGIWGVFVCVHTFIEMAAMNEAMGIVIETYILHRWFCLQQDLRPEATKKRKQATEEEEEGEGEEGEGDRPLKLSRSDREALRIRSGKVCVQ